MMVESRSVAPACLIELIPRSDKAKLIDLVKFRGTVPASLGSMQREFRSSSSCKRKGRERERKGNQIRT